MKFQSKYQRLSGIRQALKERLPIKMGVNKTAQLERLIFEILVSKDISLTELFDLVELEKIIAEGKGDLFSRVKKALVFERYPSFEGSEKLRLMPVKIEKSDKRAVSWDNSLEPERVFIEKSVKDLAWTERFNAFFPKAEKILVDGMKETLFRIGRCDGAGSYQSRKDNVFLMKKKGPFVKKCPCSPGCLGCYYHILDLGFGCPIDCAYCYLQNYSNFPGLVLPANFDDALSDIRNLNSRSRQVLRVGTGEFTDSLALEKYTGYAKALIEFFRGKERLVLELKTKTCETERLVFQDPPENTVLSWSLNTPRMADLCEKGSCSVSERLQAAGNALQKGFKIAFHFDPVIFYDHWREEYTEVIDRIVRNGLFTEDLKWISLGTLRYTPGLKQMAERRFLDMKAFYEGQFFLDVDGKMRYPLKNRTDMYNTLYREIRKRSNSVWVYLCMETEEAWRKSSLEIAGRAYHNS